MVFNKIDILNNAIFIIKYDFLLNHKSIPGIIILLTDY